MVKLFERKLFVEEDVAAKGDLYEMLSAQPSYATIERFSSQFNMQFTGAFESIFRALNAFIQSDDRVVNQ